MDHKQVITDEELEILKQMQTLEELGKHYDKAEALKKALMIIGAYKQVRWERDIAIQQLKELGYELGEKIREEDKRVKIISETIDGVKTGLIIPKAYRE